MDLSALIFVALAAAWAVYLIPKALKHHEEDAVSRSVEGFSDRLRVLARREPVNSNRAELVVSGRTTPRAAAAATAPEAEAPDAEAPVADAPDAEAAATAATTGDAAAAADVETSPLTPRQIRFRRNAARQAAQRRRRVLGLLLLANVVLLALAFAGVVAWPFVAIPATLLVGWLVTCRLMVRRERAARVAPTRVRKRRRTLADEALAAESDEPAADSTDDVAAEVRDDTDEIPAVRVEDEEPVAGGWDPVPMTLPTYVDKAPAGRTVRTIDLDSTGVWSSGRSASDSALAREADSDRARAEAPSEKRRASGA